MFCKSSGEVKWAFLYTFSHSFVQEQKNSKFCQHFFNHFFPTSTAFPASFNLFSIWWSRIWDRRGPTRPEFPILGSTWNQETLVSGCWLSCTHQGSEWHFMVVPGHFRFGLKPRGTGTRLLQVAPKTSRCKWPAGPEEFLEGHTGGAVTSRHWMVCSEVSGKSGVSSFLSTWPQQRFQGERATPWEVWWTVIISRSAVSLCSPCRIFLPVSFVLAVQRVCFEALFGVWRLAVKATTRFWMTFWVEITTVVSLSARKPESRPSEKTAVRTRRSQILFIWKGWAKWTAGVTMGHSCLCRRVESRWRNELKDDDLDGCASRIVYSQRLIGGWMKPWPQKGLLPPASCKNTTQRTRTMSGWRRAVPVLKLPKQHLMLLIACVSWLTSVFRWFEVGRAIWAQMSQISASQIKAHIGSIFQKYDSSFIVKMRIDFGIFWALLVYFKLAILHEEGICQIWILGFLRSKGQIWKCRKNGVWM